MLKIVVLADDFTGANGTGVLLKKSGLRVCTLLDPSHITAQTLADFDAVSFSTASRALPVDAAYARVQEAADQFGQYPVQRFAKRIDSTLRGNLGAETDALLDRLGDDTMAFVVPCFPSANRMHVGGYLLVSGVPLHRTDAAHDPKNPIRTSRPAVLFAEQSRYLIASIDLEDLLEDEKRLIEKLKTFRAAGVRTVIFDAATEADIEQISRLAVHSGIPFIAVDPGPFTAAVTAAAETGAEVTEAAETTAAVTGKVETAAAKQQSTTATTNVLPSAVADPQPTIEPMATRAVRSQILLAIGSVCGVARRQLEILRARHDLLTVSIQIGELVKGEKERCAEVIRVRNEIAANCERFQICCIVGCGIDPDQRVDFAPIAACRCMSEDELSDRVNDSIGEMVELILAADCQFNALYTSGGDITVAVCRQLGAVGMKLEAEVLPLAAFGTLMQGRYDGMKMITKGGLAGNPDSLAACVDYLRGKE